MLKLRQQEEYEHHYIVNLLGENPDHRHPQGRDLCR